VDYGKKEYNFMTESDMIKRVWLDRFHAAIRDSEERIETRRSSASRPISLISKQSSDNPVINSNNISNIKSAVESSLSTIHGKNRKFDKFDT
jgi:hypothetical protein